MKRQNNDFGLGRFKEINRYAEKLVMEQEEVDNTEETPDFPLDPTSAPSEPMGNEPLPGETADDETSEDEEEETEVTPEDAEVDDTTEEIDITDLVNMTKNIKKTLEDNQGKSGNVDNKMDDIFNRLGELETKLGEMDKILGRIDDLGKQIQNIKPKTPAEKLEMRSLDSYPFNKKPDEFFGEKVRQMRDMGKNEYVLTKGDVENYGKNEILKSFNPDAQENNGFNF